MRRGAGVERPVGPHDDQHGPGGVGLYLLGVVAPHGLWADDPHVNGSVQVWGEEVTTRFSSPQGPAPSEAPNSNWGRMQFTRPS